MMTKGRAPREVEDTMKKAEHPLRGRPLVLTVALVALLVIAGLVIWQRLQPVEHDVRQVSGPASPDTLRDHCEDAIGEARVEQVTEGVFVAIGYDLANTILVRTDEGNVVIDVGMSPARAAETKRALEELAPGPTKSIVYTHSHIDHVGGASAWVEPDTTIWATEAFIEHFLDQYSLFRETETRRASRQFGVHIDDETLPCSAIGRRIDIVAAARTGMRMPTNTFNGRAQFEVGGVQFVLVEAHGETHDQLFVHVPSLGLLLPGDNYYRAFPNLYTIRGTAPRPVDHWIASIDEKRRLDPEYLVPSHTVPITGREEIRSALTRYRDGIQWVRDRVVQSANEGRSIERVSADIGLPERLASDAALQPLYGQLDWSARAIYSNHLGWFDGRPEVLYPMPVEDRAERTVSMMGGAEAVWLEAERALRDEPRWALHLLSLLRDGGLTSVEPGGRWANAWAHALEAVAATVGNTNGRGYLLESAFEARNGPVELPRPTPDDELLDAVPIRIFFDIMATRLIPEQSIDTHESVRFDFTDTEESFVITVRYGVAEVVRGDPLPGTPEPVAEVRTTTATWRRLATDLQSPASALADGDIEVSGDFTAFYTFTRRFESGL